MEGSGLINKLCCCSQSALRYILHYPKGPKNATAPFSFLLCRLTSNYFSGVAVSLTPLAAVKRSPSPEELTARRNKRNASWGGGKTRAERRNNLPKVMLEVSGRGGLQTQVSASPCCFAHWLTPPPEEPNPALMQCPLKAAGGLAAYARAEPAPFIYSLFTAACPCQPTASLEQSPRDKLAGPDLPKSLKPDRDGACKLLLSNCSCVDHPVEVRCAPGLPASTSGWPGKGFLQLPPSPRSRGRDALRR